MIEFPNDPNGKGLTIDEAYEWLSARGYPLTLRMVKRRIWEGKIPSFQVPTVRQKYVYEKTLAAMFQNPVLPV